MFYSITCLEYTELFILSTLNFVKQNIIHKLISIKILVLLQEIHGKTKLKTN
jgi:hypothetical protein